MQGNRFTAFQYDTEINLLNIWSSGAVTPAVYFKRSKLKIKRHTMDVCPWYDVDVTNNEIINSYYPCNSIHETAQFSIQISNLKSNTNGSIGLLSNFVSLLDQSYSRKCYVSIDGKFDISELLQICDDADAVRLKHFIQYIHSKLFMGKFILDYSFLKFEVYAQNITHSDVIIENKYQKIEQDENCYYATVIKHYVKHYYENCEFDISLKVVLDFDSKMLKQIQDEEFEKKYKPVEYSEDEEIILDNRFDDDESEDDDPDLLIENIHNYERLYICGSE